MESKNNNHQIPNPLFWKGKKVLVTGHTGFKGAWLSLWLLNMGAEITGISLEPKPSKNLFNNLSLESKINHQIHDIRDEKYLC